MEFPSGGSPKPGPLGPDFLFSNLMHMEFFDFFHLIFLKAMY